MRDPILQVKSLSVSAGPRPLLRHVSFDVPEGGVTGLLGPSGVGKSTLLKCCNRLVDLTPRLRVTGNVLFRGQPVFDRGVDADALRAKIGILFQQPAVFPRSILANTLFGVRHVSGIRRREFPRLAEQALREAALWDEVKDRLDQPALRLSVGQQQRLCLARTLATDPQVILMDEPTSALDPQATEAIEQLILRLRGSRTIIIVTHNHPQAQRLCDAVVHLTLVDGAGEVSATGAPGVAADQRGIETDG